MGSSSKFGRERGDEKKHSKDDRINQSHKSANTETGHDLETASEGKFRMIHSSNSPLATMWLLSKASWFMADARHLSSDR